MFVKICGITNEGDALLAVAMGADAVGFIFAPSRRQVTPTVAGDIAKRLPPEILTVGVFRNESPLRVVEIVNTAGLKAAQLHGHETPTDTEFVRARVPFVIKVFAAGDRQLDKAELYPADAIMIDSPEPGSGDVFDWSLAEGAPPGRRIIMAGGLTAENVGDAIERVNPWGVCVDSGVEADEGEPGHKDPSKVRRFIANAQAAEPADYQSDFAAPYDWMEDAP